MNDRLTWIYVAKAYRAEVEKLEAGGYQAKFTGPDGTQEQRFEVRRAATRWCCERIDVARDKAEAGRETIPAARARTSQPGEGTATAFGTRTGD
jgi:hypothetical protein